jgi:hypothetical protein
MRLQWSLLHKMPSGQELPGSPRRAASGNIEGYGNQSALKNHDPANKGAGSPRNVSEVRLRMR